MKTFNHNSGQYADIDGGKIYFEEIGNKEKPALLILHGGFENIENLNSIASYLSEEFRVIGIDSRGHGKSTLGSKKLTYEQLQSDAETILTQLKINTVNIFGFSDGGIAAYRIAASKRIKVKKLVTMGSSWSEEDIIKAEGILKTITPESAKEIFSENFETYQRLNPEPDFEMLTQSLAAMWLDKTSTGHPNESVEDISAKTLLIRGDNDFLVSLESLSELKDKIKGSSFLNVSFAEHAVYEEQPQVVEIMLKQFFNE
ncbi:alpha/beta hydrolase [Desulfococcaceae bacterium HSG8]|nr:alpha/beta hydrolase [Desulfococcaceae bacterium HSG8]